MAGGTIGICERCYGVGDVSGKPMSDRRASERAVRMSTDNVQDSPNA